LNTAFNEASTSGEFIVIQSRHLVERFYHELWNKDDEVVAGEILDRAFRFRGSLGTERVGPEGFIDYMRSVHAALADFECIICDLIESERRAAAQLKFTGVHRGDFFGVSATGREIRWSGAAFFTTDGHRITELWVLGDVDTVKRQLGASAVSSF
jgi:predicted ester cyclase